MKIAFKSIIISLLVLSFASPVKAQNTLVLVNNTRHKIKASFVYYDNSCGCFVSRGWRTIHKYESNTINLDELGITNRTMYVHGEHGFRNWGRTLPFSMHRSGHPMRYADHWHRNHFRKMFTELTLKDGQNTFTFTHR